MLATQAARDGVPDQGAIVKLNVAVLDAPVMSVAVTLTVNGLPTAVVGVPLITPVSGFRLSPGGSPVLVQANVVMAGSESVADIVRLNGVPTVPDWAPGLVTLTTVWIVQVKVADPDAPVVSVTVTCTVNGLPVAAVFVPLITPVEGSMDRPGGSPVAW